MSVEKCVSLEFLAAPGTERFYTHIKLFSRGFHPGKFTGKTGGRELIGCVQRQA